MAEQARAPAEVIRDWLERNGPVMVGIEAFAQTWQAEKLGRRDRRRIDSELRAAGVSVAPALRKAGADQRFELSLRRPQSSDARRQLRWLVAAALALMVIGSLGPWAKAVFVTDYGLDREGALVIGAAALAALALLRWPVVAAGLGAAAIGIIASDFRELRDDSFVDPAWGLYAAALLVIASMSMLARRG